MGTPALSPDGQWSAVEVTTYRMAENDSMSDIWLLATVDKKARRLTTKGRNADPAWSPDGRTIAFVSKQDGAVAQIFVVNPDDPAAAPKQLTRMPMSPFGLKWSPDGKTIFCIARTWPDTPDDAAYLRKEKAFRDNKVKAFIIDTALYRVWNEWIADGRRPAVFAID